MAQVMSTLPPSYIVGIGGSAGSLNAYKALLESLPSNTGMVFVVVSHIHPAANSQLAEILSRHTKMPVLLAFTAMPIRANHVYVMPANTDLYIENHAFKVVSPRSRGNTQIDLFFISLAEAKGALAIGIVLSGYDGDGTEGSKSIKARGGTTFAQDMSAEVGEMSSSAQASGYIDFVLPPEKMAEALARLGARFVQDGRQGTTGQENSLAKKQKGTRKGPGSNKSEQ
ncbi:MAG: chemotaxis protein CheB [Betaproteobacteria bacterium]